MSTQHTPGPWITDGHGNVYAKALYRHAPFEGAPDFHEGLVALPYGSGDGNALLIAAAPELLQALSQAVESMQDSGYPNDHIAIKAARAAIAKAKGSA